MSSTAAVWLLLLVALVAANLPFLNERIALLGPLRRPKALAWRLFELLILCGVTIALGFLLESHIGQVQSQGWEFYASMVCLFVTLAFPGFVWRYLHGRRS